MRKLILAWNPDTRRCHGVRPGSLALRNPRELIRIQEIPGGVSLPEVCMLVEKRSDIRQRGHGVYAELLKKTRQRKAG